jgi:glycine cleavage system H protein
MAFKTPAELQYARTHEWIRIEGDEATIGITDYAQDALGDVVFVDLPEVGRQVAQGEAIAEVESTKSVSEIYAPVAGTVVDVNAELSDNPERLNEEPYGEGWIFALELDDPAQLDELLDAEGYRALIEG